MDGKLLLRLERCLRCQGVFPICRSCYHGQAYCSDDCRKPARTSQLRALRAAYQASPGGREDHRDRNRELRKRDRELRKRAASITSVMDQGSEILAPSSSVCLPQGPTSLMSSELEVEGRNHDDDDSTDSVSDNEPTLDEGSGEAGRRRGVEGGLADAEDATPPSVADAPRGDGTLVPGSGARCAVCHRGGVVVSAWPSRRPVPERRYGALHGRASPARARAPPAHRRAR